MTVNLKPFEQRPEFLPVFISSTASATAQTIKLDIDDNLPPGCYHLSIIGYETNPKSTATTFSLRQYTDADQSVVGPALEVRSINALTSSGTFTMSGTSTATAAGYSVAIMPHPASAVYAGDAGKGILVPYGLQVTLTNNASSTMRLDLIAQRVF